MPKYDMHVISHTHWDREWYLPFQRFRMMLVDLVDGLLDILDKDPDYKYFNFDGQTIVLEDYLQIRPHKRAILEKYIKEGRILVGPWYQLNDEYLVSGEATVRSLLIGHRVAKEFGPVMKVGYLPDQFGNIGQMPQILQGFGIDNAIFGRGYRGGHDRKMELYWESPDGSQVLTSFMAHWYNNAQRFPSDTDEAVKYTEHIRDSMKVISHIDQLLLMNGVDHLNAQPDLSGIIARVNEKLDGDKLVHSTMPAYIDALKEALKKSKVKLDTYKGELREDRDNQILAGTLSSRIYIKQANERSQTALEKYAEPAASFAYMLGSDYPQDFLTYAWKLLMQNHPHDSICGCSVDQVHKEMMPRFDQVQQVAEDLTIRALSSISEKLKTDTDSLVVHNTLNWARTDKVTAEIYYQLGEPDRTRAEADMSKDVKAVRILDDKGKEVPHAVIDSRIMPRLMLKPDQLPEHVIVRQFEIEFVAEDIPACGYRTYKIEKIDRKLPVHESVASAAYWDNALDNEYLRLSLINGSLVLERLEDSEDLPVGDVYSNLNLFEDMGDVGDEYLYTKPVNDTVVTSLGENANVSIIRRDPVSATYKLETTLSVPAEAAINGLSRSEAKVDIPITSYVTVTRGVPRVDIKTVVSNKAKNHRLRVLFPTGIDTNVSYSEGQFDVIERKVGVPDDWRKAATFYPQQSWVDVNDGERGLCIINKGLPEYEVYEDAGRTIALTLLRSVGHLAEGYTVDDEKPLIYITPEAQCIGEYTFEYSVYPHTGDWKDAQVWKQAHQHNVPLRAVQTGAHEGSLPVKNSFVETSSPELIISAIKKAEDSNMLVVRFFNPTSGAIKNAWVKVQGAKSAKLLNMNEEVIGDMKFKDGKASPEVGAKKIITLGFELG